MASDDVLISDLTIGDRFLHNNKLHIKTDTRYVDNYWCVEYYSGKLIGLPKTQIVKRSN